VYEQWIPVYYRVVFHGMNVHNLFTHSPTEEHLGCFHFGLL
jgi:hypothetical protein